MSFKKKIFIGIISLAAFIVVWNICFPRIYTKITYPKAEFISTHTENGRIYSGIMTPSDFGHRYATFFLYDKENDIEFHTYFEFVWYFPVYLPDTPYYELEIYLDEKKKKETMLSDFEKIICYHTDDFVLLSDDAYDDYGCHILVKQIETEELAALTAELDKCVDKHSVTSINQNGFDISYSIFICMDDEIYELLAAKDYFNGAGIFSYLPNFKNVEITASFNGFSSEIYENLGDPTYDEYQDPSSFDHLVFYYDSSPYCIRNQELYFSLYGINELE